MVCDLKLMSGTLKKMHLVPAAFSCQQKFFTISCVKRVPRRKKLSTNCYNWRLKCCCLSSIAMYYVFYSDIAWKKDRKHSKNPRKNSIKRLSYDHEPPCNVSSVFFVRINKMKRKQNGKQVEDESQCELNFCCCLNFCLHIWVI